MARSGRFKRQAAVTDRKGEFDPEDRTKVEHHKYGIWDYYEEKNPETERVPASSKVENFMALYKDLPFFLRMMKDVGSLKSCRLLLLCYIVLEVMLGLLPSARLWFSGQLLTIVQEAIDSRALDYNLLFTVAAGRVACGLASLVLGRVKERVSFPLNSRINQYYSMHIYHAMARLDLPTFDDDAMQRQLQEIASPHGMIDSGPIAWRTMQNLLRMFNAGLQLVSQVGVIAHVLMNQRDGTLLAVLTLAASLMQWNQHRIMTRSHSTVWAATTKNENYIRMQGLKSAVSKASHRQEIVAGGMWQYMLDQFKKVTRLVGDDALDFQSALSHYQHYKFNIRDMFKAPLEELPLIVFTLRAIQYPSNIPISVASLNLINQSMSSFAMTLFMLFDVSESIGDSFANVRKLYEIVEVPNQIPDGKKPFPEDARSLEHGVSIEFKDVSFRYPGASNWALKHISFRIEAGQLCVIVGENGSGKSTILKLIARLYETQEGTILLNSTDIKELKLDDLRRATCVLFQDYTHFPLSIKDNIGLGDPLHADDEDAIRAAARLGGAEEFILARCSEGFDTYLDRPVRDYYSGLPEGTKNLFGRTVDYSRLRGEGGMRGNAGTSLSGGQMQRIALSRTFMRSVASDEQVGLLLFDEPSASLDPTAEHDLFERLRQLRGNKTMMFSSHRFGNLTRHADLLLYIRDSVIVEEGTHAALIKRGGEYARIWNLQAQSFIS